MQTVTCPHCRSTNQNDGSRSGQAVACVACGGHFKMPFVVPTVAPFVVPKTSHAISPQRKPRRHWAKTAMILATIAWPILICGFGGTRAANTRNQYQQVDDNTYIDSETTAVVSAKRLDGVEAMAFFAVAIIITMAYFFAMFVLFVLWFATNGG